MKLVGYQQPPCLCVRMEFVVRIISLSSEWYSVSWSCFRSRGSGTLVCVKWRFDLHVECCGSCMVSTTGEGAGKFLGMRKIFARKVLGDFAYKFFPQRSWRPFFEMTSLFRDDLGMKKGLHVFFCILWNQTRLGAIFARIFRYLAQIFKDFAQIFNKSKLLGVCLHPPPPTPLVSTEFST